MQNKTYKTIITQFENNLCIGCGLCKLVCPADCIEMVWTDKSCWKPTIDESKCIKYTIGLMCSYCVSDQKDGNMVTYHGVKADDLFSINYRNNIISALIFRVRKNFVFQG